MPIVWSPWHAEAFARARAESKPVLLSISAVWCRGCREMDRTSYADPAVERLVTERFVAVRVDADRRPDIAERYGLGGLPTTAFLTAEGDLAGGGTFVPVERLAGVLERAVEAFRARGDEIAGGRRTGSAARAAAQPAPRPAEDALIGSVFASYDAEHGGFGVGPKFPITAPLHLALELYAASSDPAARGVVESTLDAMCTRELYDEVDGGFFRLATTRDWRWPRHEKLLDVNAAMLRVLTDAAAVLDSARYAEAAGDLLRYLAAALADAAEGGWFGSQAASDEYYAGPTAASRRLLPPPPVDRTLYASWNGAMISAALRAARMRDDAGLAEFAIRSLERILVAGYRPGAGVAHYLDGGPRVRGLLEDQIAMAAAALDAAEATGRVPYEMIAEELALYALRTMWDEGDGGLFDRAPGDGPDDLGLLREPVKPFVANCQAARLFVRLAASSGNHDFTSKAAEILDSLAPAAAGEGPLAAHYVLAMREAALR